VIQTLEFNIFNILGHVMRCTRSINNVALRSRVRGPVVPGTVRLVTAKTATARPVETAWTITRVITEIPAGPTRFAATWVVERTRTIAKITTRSTEVATAPVITEIPAATRSVESTGLTLAIAKGPTLTVTEIPASARPVEPSAANERTYRSAKMLAAAPSWSVSEMSRATALEASRSARGGRSRPCVRKSAARPAASECGALVRETAAARALEAKLAGRRGIAGSSAVPTDLSAGGERGAN
jgi:hypothetical protein